MIGRGLSPVTGGRFDLWIPGASMGVVTVTARVCRGAHLRSNKPPPKLPAKSRGNYCQASALAELAEEGAKEEAASRVPPRTAAQIIVCAASSRLSSLRQRMGGIPPPYPASHLSAPGR